MKDALTGAVPPGIGAIVVGSFPLSAGQWFDAHDHPEHHQLAWTPRGVLGIAIDEEYWILPPTKALWIPKGVVHRTGATRDAELRSLYLESGRCELDWAVPTPVGVGGMLAQLIAYLHRDLTDDARRRAEAVVPDLLQPLPATPIHVPQPADERVRAVADTLLADPGDRRSLDAHARAVGVSRRTLTRLFVNDTGMSFDQWRTNVRLRAALALIAEGQPVSRVAHQIGYATPSAFLAAFRRTIGTSPKRYLSGTDTAG